MTQWKLCHLCDKSSMLILFLYHQIGVVCLRVPAARRSPESCTNIFIRGKIMFNYKRKQNMFCFVNSAPSGVSQPIQIFGHIRKKGRERNLFQFGLTRGSLSTQEKKERCCLFGGGWEEIDTLASTYLVYMLCSFIRFFSMWQQFKRWSCVMSTRQVE
jgi:hypothetical protein